LTIGQALKRWVAIARIGIVSIDTDRLPIGQGCNHAVYVGVVSSRCPSSSSWDHCYGWGFSGSSDHGNIPSCASIVDHYAIHANRKIWYQLI